MRNTEIAKSLSSPNRRQVMYEILMNGPLPRTEITERVGITQASVSRITRSLIDAGLIEETGRVGRETGPGRHRIGIGVRPDGGFVAAISINLFQQDIVVANIANKTVLHERLSFPSLEFAGEVLQVCALKLNQLIVKSGIDRSRLLGCSVTVTGAMDPDRSMLVQSPILGWSNVDIASIIERELGTPFVLESIPNAKNMAAHCFGPSRCIDDIVLFNCSLAIGNSILVEGKLLRGTKSQVGLIQSLHVPDKSGKPSPLDLMAGGLGVIGEKNISSSMNRGKLASKLIRFISSNGSDTREGGRKLRQAGESLAFAIMAANAFLHPQKILLSGPMIKSQVYREGIIDAAADMLGAKFVNEHIEFFEISNQRAARSLAIYHYLTQPGGCE